MEPHFSLPAVVTGSSGFVGRVLVRRLHGGCAQPRLGGADWREQIAATRFSGATVFHLAARVHRRGDPDAAFTFDNVEKTRTLAVAAAEGGARRFVFLSSIKVNGEETTRAPFRPTDAPAPGDAYARSKWAAETELQEVGRRRNLPVTIVRSPLVVGAGAGGNLTSLLRLADGPWPLPFAAIENRRTFVHVEDLACLLCAAGTAPEAQGQLFLAGDPDAVSTPRLVRTLRRALHRAERLVPVPPRLLDTVAALVGARERMRRLTASLEVDVSQTQRVLDWRPGVPMDEGLAQMAGAFARGRR